MELSGKVIAVLPVENGTSKSGNPWQKQSFVILTPGQYGSKICFQLFGEMVGYCPKEGETVKVSFDIGSREWNGRWFTQLDAWKVEQEGMQTSVAPNTPPQPPVQPMPQAQPQQDNDPLPF